MKKIIRIILLWIIILFLFQLYSQKASITEYNTLPNNEDIGKVLELNIIDKYNNMEKIYENPMLEQYYEFDLIIDGIYYYNVGIRAKGTTIYYWLEDNGSNKISFKIRLDYRDPNQNYNGMTEFHVNAQAMDPTGMREYLIYDIYNEVGIDTQKYCFADLQIDSKSIGLVTIVEVINESYVEYTYNSTEGNLYKPSNAEYKGIYGADLSYRGNDLEQYRGIFDNIKTENTTLEDQERLVEVLKKIDEANTPEEIESCFMDFDKVLKILALNKVVSNVDGIIGRTMRNYFIYEENGKIDIIAFDFNLSLGIQPKEYFFTDEDVNDLGLIEYTYDNHSNLVDIVMENEVFLERYNEHVKDIQSTMDKMQLDKRIDAIDMNIKQIVQNDTEFYYTYTEYRDGVIDLKKFIQGRIEN